MSMRNSVGECVRTLDWPLGLPVNLKLKKSKVYVKKKKNAEASQIKFHIIGT